MTLNIKAKKFYVAILQFHLLSEDEILQVFDQIRCPKSIYKDGSQDFKDILAIPFNLWLLEKILKKLHRTCPILVRFTPKSSYSVCFGNGGLRTEKSEHFLRQIADKMVQERSLSVRIDKIDDVDLDEPVFDKLQSDEILAKVSSTGKRVAFSHNILFDYAISVLFIDDEPQIP